MQFEEEVELAARRIRPYVRETPLERSPWLSALTGGEVFLKLENLQITGSFKARGALNALLAAGTTPRGFVTASTGNHGAAIAYGLKTLGLKGTVFLPRKVSKTKWAHIAQWGVPIRFFGEDSEETETHARRFAKRTGCVYVSPYNDSDVIAGQGTIGWELHAQGGAKGWDALIASVGGGGLIRGTGGFLQQKKPLQVIGASPKNSCVMVQSVKAGEIRNFSSRATLSDGTAGGIEKDCLTFEWCRQNVNDWVLVSETEIRAALRGVLDHHCLLLEGAAGVAVAAVLKQGRKLRGKRTAVILCGSKISRATLRQVL